MNTFKLNIATPDGSVFSGEAESLLITTTEGEREFLAGHSDFCAAIGIGRARVRADGKNRTGAVNGGILTVKNGDVTVSALTFEFSDMIDTERARRARETAERRLSSASDERMIKLARAKLARANIRIKVSEKKTR